MPLLYYIPRFLRKKLVLTLVFCWSFLYFVISFLYEPSYPPGVDIDSSVPLRNLDSFIWHTDDDDDGNSSKLITCRNSVQGKMLMVDDKGFVCTRLQILPNGCCDQTARGVIRYPCRTCKSIGCCGVYEYCVSCCLHPNKKELLQQVLLRAPSAFNVMFSSVSDHYELCLAKCRTSSLSVHHENTYRDPTAKHCYSDTVVSPVPDT